MKKRVIFLSGLLLISAVLFGSISFSRAWAWYVDKDDNGPVTAETAKIATELEFELNTNYGIPGETISITKANKIFNNGTRDYIFKISYTVSDADGPYIDDLKLADADGLELILAEEYNESDNNTVAYYGKHKVADAEMDLGGLDARFLIMNKSEMGKPFYIEAEVTACQATKEAAQDIFGIDPDDDDYVKLFD